jgi:hypothetical protein
VSDERKNLETVTYVGTVASMEEKKGGWYRIHVAIPGKQWPVKPETKLENLIAKAREIRDSGVVATWTIEEWDSDNINPNTSKPYTERRLAAVEEGVSASAPSEAAAPHQAEAHHDPIHFADKDRAITRMACLKSASVVFQGAFLREGDVGLEVMKLAQRFESWIYRDIDPAPFQ